MYVAITTLPCLEFWPLLHFKYTTKPYGHLLAKSACELVQGDLKPHMPDSEKGARGAFRAFRDRLNLAEENAARGLREAEANGTDKPTTRVHMLVPCLQTIEGSP